jgi:hypothetical protein
MGYSTSNIEEYKWNYKYLLDHQVDILENSIHSLINDSEQRVSSALDKLENMKKMMIRYKIYQKNINTATKAKCIINMMK